MKNSPPTPFRSRICGAVTAMFVSKYRRKLAGCRWMGSSLLVSATAVGLAACTTLSPGPTPSQNTAQTLPATNPYPSIPQTPATQATLSPVASVERFAAALRAGDKAALRTLLDPEVIIAESGYVERSLEEYAAHHMSADIAFTAAVTFALKKRDTLRHGDLASVISESHLHGSYKGKDIHSRVMETILLRRTATDWRIVHIHWSSAPLAPEQH